MKTTTLFLFIFTLLFSANSFANACSSLVKERKSTLKSIDKGKETIEENLKRFDEVVSINRFDVAKSYITRAQTSVNNITKSIKQKLERSNIVYPSCKDSDRRRLDNYVEKLNEELRTLEALNIYVTELSSRF